MYSPQLLDHFEHPRNSGQLENSTAKVRLENPVCGDIVELGIRIVDDHVDDLKFLARGCVPAMACASAMTELAKGRPIVEARALSREDIIRAVGGVPPASVHAAQLALDVLKSALKCR